MNFGNIFYAVVALAFVLGLFALFALAARRFGFGYPMTANNSKREKRLSLIETMPLDAKRRLVLLKRDNAEHLVILGSSSELLIESLIREETNMPVIKEKT